MNKNQKFNITLFILLPFLSIIIGYFGMKIYMVFNDGPSKFIEISNTVDEFNNNVQTQVTKENETTEGEETSNVNHSFLGISVNCIQVGSFSSYDNAVKNGYGFKEKWFW